MQDDDVKPAPARRKRKAVTKKLRFEVFKRDSFTCQYCGQSAPDVILHVDHIQPVATGGAADILNLITSCRDCNLGKGPRELSDDSSLRKQRDQLAELNERREQMEQMVKWREELRGLDDAQVDGLEELFRQITGYGFSDYGRNAARKWLKRHPFAELYEAMEAAAQSYWKAPSDDEERSRQANKVFDYTPRIIGARKRYADRPWMRDLFYVRAMVRNKFGYCNERVALDLLERAHAGGAHFEELKDWAAQARNWSNWRDEMEVWVEELEGNE